MEEVNITFPGQQSQNHAQLCERQHICEALDISVHFRHLFTQQVLHKCLLIVCLSQHYVMYDR